MRSNHQRPKNTDRQLRVMRSAGAASKDAGSEQLQRVSRKMGNQDFGAQLDRTSQQRDELLAFIAQRLKSLHSVQNVERLEMRDQRQWYREVAKGTHGYHLPDTTRWHESARCYRQAAESLAAGNLTRGAQQLERALEAERTAYASMPRQVQVELEEAESTASSTPDSLPHAINGGMCQETTLPTEIRELSGRILSVRDVMEDAPPLPLRQWWETDLEEEEEEEEEDDD